MDEYVITVMVTTVIDPLLMVMTVGDGNDLCVCASVSGLV